MFSVKMNLVQHVEAKKPAPGYFPERAVDLGRLRNKVGNYETVLKKNLSVILHLTFSTLEIIFCAFLAENYFVKVLIQLIWASTSEIIFCACLG